jgi:alpha-amylase
LSFGITAAWLPPAYKGMKGNNSEGYDVYDIYDLGEFDQKGSIPTKYGTKEEYINAVNSARAAGLKIYVDVVLNHMGGAEETEKFKVRKVNPDNRMEFISDEMEIEGHTLFKFPGRGGKYSNFIWDHQCFTGLDYSANPEETAIFSILNEYGDSWEELADTEKGNFDYLILNDIEFRNPAVREEMKRWGKWYFETVNFDGVRLDAVKHISPSFFNEWLDYMRSEVKPDLHAIGEYWLSDNLSVLLKYIDATEGRMSLFDAPLHHNLSQASIHREHFDLRTIFNDTLIAVKPELAITFVDNHDTQPLQSLEEATEQWFKPHAYALILLREAGYPCIFYPDLYGTCYVGKSQEGEDREVELPVLECLVPMLEVRRDHAYGEQHDYFDDPHCIGWLRKGVKEIPGSGCVVLLSNDMNNGAEKKIELGEEFVGRVFNDILHKDGQKITIDENGWGTFNVRPADVSVWVPES